MCIDGTTQPGYAGSPIIEIDGSLVGSGNISGLWVEAGGSTVRGLVINRFPGRGIVIWSGSNSSIRGCYIGTDVSGTVALANSLDGIHVGSDASYNTIGGLAPNHRNVISGNGDDGIGISGSGTLVIGNYVGTDVSGTLPLGNGANGVVTGVLNGFNTIGGSIPEARNVICDNTRAGVGFTSSTFNNIVVGNYIGVDVTGTVGLGNHMMGVWIGHDTYANTVGGAEPGSRNVISANMMAGVHFEDTAHGNHVLGNYIGTDASGVNPLGNHQEGVLILGSAAYNTIGGTIAGSGNNVAANVGTGVRISSGSANGILVNSIHDNGALGIDLSPAGVTPNDFRDLDTRANTLQNYPELLSAYSSEWGSSIRGKLNSSPSATFRIELFSNNAADPSGYGEGETFIQAMTETADGTGNAFFTVILSAPLPVGTYITSTATNALNNTSEFSEAVLVQEMALMVELQVDGLLLEWSSVPEIAEYWVFGAANDAFLEPDGAPGYENRLAIVNPEETSWLTEMGIGNPVSNWTYLVMAVDASDQELCRTNRTGEFDFAVGGF